MMDDLSNDSNYSLPPMRSMDQVPTPGESANNEAEAGKHLSCHEEENPDLNAFSSTQTSTKRASVIEIWKRRERESLERQKSTLLNASTRGKNPVNPPPTQEEKNSKVKEQEVGSNACISSHKHALSFRNTITNNGPVGSPSRAEESPGKDGGMSESPFLTKPSDASTTRNNDDIRSNNWFPLNPIQASQGSPSPQYDSAATSPARSEVAVDLMSRRNLPEMSPLRIPLDSPEEVVTEKQVREMGSQVLSVSSPRTSKKQKAQKRRSSILDIWSQREKTAMSPPSVTRRSPASVTSCFFDMEAEISTQRPSCDYSDSADYPEETFPLEKQTVFVESPKRHSLSVLERWKSGMIHTDDFSSSQEASPLSAKFQNKRQFHLAESGSNNLNADVSRSESVSVQQSPVSQQTTLLPVSGSQSQERMHPFIERPQENFESTYNESVDGASPFDEDRCVQHPPSEKSVRDGRGVRSMETSKRRVVIVKEDGMSNAVEKPKSPCRQPPARSMTTEITGGSPVRRNLEEAFANSSCGTKKPTGPVRGCVQKSGCNTDFDHSKVRRDHSNTFGSTPHQNTNYSIESVSSPGKNDTQDHGGDENGNQEAKMNLPSGAFMTEEGQDSIVRLHLKTSLPSNPEKRTSGGVLGRWINRSSGEQDQKLDEKPDAQEGAITSDFKEVDHKKISPTQMRPGENQFNSFIEKKHSAVAPIDTTGAKILGCAQKERSSGQPRALPKQGKNNTTSHQQTTSWGLSTTARKSRFPLSLARDEADFLRLDYSQESILSSRSDLTAPAEDSVPVKDSCRDSIKRSKTANLSNENTEERTCAEVQIDLRTCSSTLASKSCDRLGAASCMSGREEEKQNKTPGPENPSNQNVFDSTGKETQLKGMSLYDKIDAQVRNSNAKTTLRFPEKSADVAKEIMPARNRDPDASGNAVSTFVSAQQSEKPEESETCKPAFKALPKFVGAPSDAATTALPAVHTMRSNCGVSVASTPCKQMNHVQKESNKPGNEMERFHSQRKRRPKLNNRSGINTTTKQTSPLGTDEKTKCGNRHGFILEKLRAQRRKLEKSNDLSSASNEMRKTKAEVLSKTNTSGKSLPSHIDTKNQKISETSGHTEEHEKIWTSPTSLSNHRAAAANPGAYTTATSRPTNAKTVSSSPHHANLDATRTHFSHPPTESPASDAGQSDTLSFFTHAGSAFSGYSAPSSCSGVLDAGQPDPGICARGLADALLNKPANVAQHHPSCFQPPSQRRASANPDEFLRGRSTGLALKYNTSSRFLDPDALATNSLGADNSTVNSAMHSSQANSTYSSETSRGSFDSGGTGSESGADIIVNETKEHQTNKERRRFSNAETVLQDDFSEAFQNAYQSFGIKRLTALDLHQLRIELNEGVQAASDSLKRLVKKTVNCDETKNCATGTEGSTRGRIPARDSPMDEGIAIEVEYVSDSDDDSDAGQGSVVDLDVLSAPSEGIFSLDTTETGNTTGLVYIGKVHLDSD